MKFREIEHFNKTQAYYTIGGFIAPIKINVISVSYKTTFLAYTLNKNKHLKTVSVAYHRRDNFNGPGCHKKCCKTLTSLSNLHNRQVHFFCFHGELLSKTTKK